MSTASRTSNPLITVTTTPAKAAVAQRLDDNLAMSAQTNSFSHQLQDRQAMQRQRPASAASPQPKQVATAHSAEQPKPTDKASASNTADAVPQSAEAAATKSHAEKPAKAEGEPQSNDQAAQAALPTDTTVSAMLAQQLQPISLASDAPDSVPVASDELTKDINTLAKTITRAGRSEVDSSLTSIDTLSPAAASLATDRQTLPDAALGMLSQPVPDLVVPTTPTAAGGIDANMAKQQLAVGTVTTEAPRKQDTEATKSAFAIHVPIGAEGWDRALGHKVVMMVSNQKQEVEMQLNPPHLGPMDVKITLNQDQAAISFVVAHAPVKEALQASMSRLTEMMAESGIQLTQANVQTRDGQGGDSREPARDNRNGRIRQTGNEEIAIPITALQSRLVKGLPGNVNLFV